jgi:hypothetical protein
MTTDTAHTAPETGALTAHDSTSNATVAQYRTYTEAQDAVDYLSENRFPVHEVTIVGRGLTSVERVTGRMTKTRAALAGAATGAWVGLLIGALLALFTPGLIVLGALTTSIGLGAMWGAVIGFVCHWATRGRRDFTSLHGLAAERYDVVVSQDIAAEALRLLTQRRDR